MRCPFYRVKTYSISKLSKHSLDIVEVKIEAAAEENACKDDKYRIHFKATMLHSIRRSDPRLAWPYAVFILKDGTTQPALHFHSGGITAMISQLQRYIWLTRYYFLPFVIQCRKIRKVLHFV